jgi:hypothetical protein
MEEGELVARNRQWILVVLFTTGFASLAMEVAWVWACTFVLSTTVYAFAAVLTTYLLALARLLALPAAPRRASERRAVGH